jgi:hypothetical protein
VRWIVAQLIKRFGNHSLEVILVTSKRRVCEMKREFDFRVTSVDESTRTVVRGDRVTDARSSIAPRLNLRAPNDGASFSPGEFPTR